MLLEVDLGHYSRGRILEKAEGFRKHPDARGIVFICSTNDRANRVADWIREGRGSGFMRRCQVFTMDEIKRGAPFAPGSAPVATPSESLRWYDEILGEPGCTCETRRYALADELVRLDQRRPDRCEGDHPLVAPAAVRPRIANEPESVNADGPDVRSAPSRHAGEEFGGIEIEAEEHTGPLGSIAAGDARLGHPTPVKTVPLNRRAILTTAGVVHDALSALHKHLTSPR